MTYINHAQVKSLKLPPFKQFNLGQAVVVIGAVPQAPHNFGQNELIIGLIQEPTSKDSEHIAGSLSHVRISQSVPEYAGKHSLKKFDLFILLIFFRTVFTMCKYQD
jgi:hypothetical protein